MQQGVQDPDQLLERFVILKGSSFLAALWKCRREPVMELTQQDAIHNPMVGTGYPTIAAQQ